MPSLTRITIYPIKSLDGHDVAASKVLPNGALAEDRRYALVDSLVAETHKVRRFRLGKHTWQGHGLCQRCVVPTRNSSDGTTTEGFARKFSARRQETLPSWAVRERFDHFYRLGVNTRMDSADDGASLCVGDAVELIA